MIFELRTQFKALRARREGAAYGIFRMNIINMILKMLFKLKSFLALYFVTNIFSQKELWSNKNIKFT